MLQCLNHLRQGVVVGAFGHHVTGTQARAKPIVERLAVIQGDLNEPPPARPGARLAGLQGDDHGPAGRLEVGFGVEANLGCAVVSLQIAQRLGIGTALIKVGEQHAKLGAPIAHVVLPNDLMAKRFENACHRIADDGAAQVPHMHLLG